MAMTSPEGFFVREKGICNCSDNAKRLGSCFHRGCVSRKWIMGRAILENQKGYIALFDPDLIEVDKIGAGAPNG